MNSAKIGEIEKFHKQGKKENQFIQRSLERNISELEKEEKQLENNIKRMAEMGMKSACGPLALQLSKIRAMKLKLLGFGSHMDCIQSKQTTSLIAVRYGESVESATKNMKSFNKAMKKSKIPQQIQQFDEAELNMDISEECLDDLLPSLCISDEEDTDEQIVKILDDLESVNLSRWPSVPDSTLNKYSAILEDIHKETY
ncbi:unnamed protein product [Heterobilharzia americana]|nr:unnamed protein product [Heterobilharzia americana]CAH8592345.1 unnamed protein product [Heterobilharzia americana]